jgi:Immunity protein 70
VSSGESATEPTAASDRATIGVPARGRAEGPTDERHYVIWQGQTDMGLCLYVLSADPGDDEDPEEIADCNVGHYSDFGCFRDTIAAKLKAVRYPVLMQHSDCDGEWALSEIPALERELTDIAAQFKQLPPEQPVKAFEHTAAYRKSAASLYDCFHNVDGENLFDSLLSLCEAAREHRRPITFM